MLIFALFSHQNDLNLCNCAVKDDFVRAAGPSGPAPERSQTPAAVPTCLIPPCWLLGGGSSRPVSASGEVSTSSPDFSSGSRPGEVKHTLSGCCTHADLIRPAPKCAGAGKVGHVLSLAQEEEVAGVLSPELQSHWSRSNRHTAGDERDERHRG